MIVLVDTVTPGDRFGSGCFLVSMVMILRMLGGGGGDVMVAGGCDGPGIYPHNSHPVLREINSYNAKIFLYTLGDQRIFSI